MARSVSQLLLNGLRGLGASHRLGAVVRRHLARAGFGAVDVEHGAVVLALLHHILTRRNLSFSQIRPVNSNKKGVLLDFLHRLRAQTTRRLLLEKASDQVFRCVIGALLPGVLRLVLDVLVRFELGATHEGRLTENHLVKDDSQGPQICRVTNISIL